MKSQQQAQAQREEVYFAIYITFTSIYINLTYKINKACMSIQETEIVFEKSCRCI